MSRQEWSDDFLDSMRQQGDPAADAVASAVFARHDFGQLNTFLEAALQNDDVPPDVPTEIAQFIRDTSPRPPWASDERLRRAELVFTRHGLSAMVSLVCASLPECYTMRKGVRILALTRQLGAHTDRRLHQTALMVLAVMTPDGFAHRGRGVRQAQKVRLIHAAIRHLILRALGKGVSLSAPAASIDAASPASPSLAGVIAQGRFEWHVDRDGIPLNQEDLAFTLLTFGYVIPLAMQRFGVPITADDREVFLHAWNLAGYYVGVREDLMAETVEAAEHLFNRIKRRQAGPSTDGAFLTDRIVQFLQTDVLRARALAPLAPILIRSLAGNETAATLGMDTRTRGGVRVFHYTVVAGVRVLNLVGNACGRFHPLRHLGTRIGRDVIRALYDYSAQRGGAPLQIPANWLVHHGDPSATD